MALKKFSLNSVRVAVALDREGHDRRKASMVPLWALSVPQHIGREHIPCLFQGTQCTDKASSLYLPERSLACMVSQGEEPHDWYWGWHLVRPKNWVWEGVDNLGVP